MQDSDRRPVSNQRPILKFMSDFYVTDICTSDLCPFFPMTSLAYASNDVTPVRLGFWSSDGESTRPDSKWGILDDRKHKKQ